MKKIIVISWVILFINLPSVKAYEIDTSSCVSFVFSITESMVENDEDFFRNLIGISKAIKSYEEVGYTDHGLYRSMVKDSLYVQNEFINPFRKLGKEVRQKIEAEDVFDLNNSLNFEILQTQDVKGISVLEIRVRVSLNDEVVRFDIVVGSYNNEYFIFLPMDGYLLP